MSLGKVIFPETKQQKVFEPKSNFPTIVYNAIALLLMLELMLVIRPLWILEGIPYKRRPQEVRVR